MTIPEFFIYYINIIRVLPLYIQLQNDPLQPILCFTGTRLDKGCNPVPWRTEVGYHLDMDEPRVPQVNGAWSWKISLEETETLS